MSGAEETLALGRRLIETLNSRDLSRLIELSDPDVEWHSFFADVGRGGVYRGPEGTARYMADLTDAWEFVRAEVDGAIAAGDVAVLVGRLHYRGKGSGVEDEVPALWRLKFTGGRLLRFHAFRDPEQVLEGIGSAG